MCDSVCDSHQGGGECLIVIREVRMCVIVIREVRMCVIVIRGACKLVPPCVRSLLKAKEVWLYG